MFDVYRKCKVKEHNEGETHGEGHLFVIATVITPPSSTAAAGVTATAEAAAVAVVSVAASLASEESRLDTAWMGTALWVIATGVDVGVSAGGGVEDEEGAGAAAGLFAAFSGPIKLLIDESAVPPVTVEMA